MKTKEQSSRGNGATPYHLDQHEIASLRQLMREKSGNMRKELAALRHQAKK